MNPWWLWTVVAAFGGWAGLVEAQVRISGFGQFVASDQGGDGAYPFLAYTDNDISYREESLFAVQVSADLNERFSATAQILARGSEDFDPKFAWAYLSWQASDDVNIKLGRQRIPFFTFSDYLDVGYAYMWVRPPKSVYNFNFSNIDAIAFNWQGQTGNWGHQALFMTGRFDGNLQIQGVPAPGQLEKLYYGMWESSYDEAFTIRAAYGKADVTITAAQLTPLFNALDAARLSALRAALDIEQDPVTFTGLGLVYDRDAWLIGLEGKIVDIKQTYQGERHDKLAYVGFRWGNWMPYLSRGIRNTHAKRELLTRVPPALPAALRDALNQLVLTDAFDDRYDSIGVRWDVMKNVCFKFEYARYRSDLSFRAESNLASAAVAFVF